MRLTRIEVDARSTRYTSGSYRRRGRVVGMTGGGTLRTGKSPNDTGMSGTGGIGVILDG